MKQIKKILKLLLPQVEAWAHCDIPCGIYDPTPAKIAAKTVLRMILQIKEMHLPENWSNQKEFTEYLNAVTRRIQVKEEHAELCKKELRILWGDFFKEEHLEKYPQIHSLFWKAMKLASKTKQSLDENIAQELCAVIDEIAKIFYEAKNDPERFKSYKEITEKLF